MYNRFGLTYIDIIDAFTGAVSGDFSTAIDPQLSIENEMDLAVEEIVSLMSQRTINLLSHVEYQKISCPTGTFSLPWLVLNNCNLKVYKIADYNSCNSIQNNPLSCGECQPTSLCTGDEIPFVLVNTFSAAVTANGNQITITDLPTSSQAVYVSYDIDPDFLVISSLKKLLRDTVACTLGSKLYSDGTSEWKLVERYCEASKMFMEKMMNKNWAPSEFARLSFLNPIKNSAFTSHRVIRTS